MVLDTETTSGSTSTAVGTIWTVRSVTSSAVPSMRLTVYPSRVNTMAYACSPSPVSRKRPRESVRAVALSSPRSSNTSTRTPAIGPPVTESKTVPAIVRDWASSCEERSKTRHKHSEDVRRGIFMFALSLPLELFPFLLHSHHQLLKTRVTAQAFQEWGLLGQERIVDEPQLQPVLQPF